MRYRLAAALLCLGSTAAFAQGQPSGSSTNSPAMNGPTMNSPTMNSQGAARAINARACTADEVAQLQANPNTDVDCRTPARDAKPPAKALDAENRSNTPATAR